MSPEAQQQVKDLLFELLVEVLARVFFVENAKELANNLFGDELALERSINFTSSFVTLGNVLGHNPKSRLADWTQADARDFPLRRGEEWDAADRTVRKSDEARPQPVMGKGEPPAELRDPARLKHTQMQTVSLIREALWNQASWYGTAYMVDPANTRAPVLAPIFKNGTAADQIFALWRKELGEHDTEERLRVAILRGISKANPYAYRVIIGSNPSTAFAQADLKFAMMLYRLNTMEPAADLNLSRFLASYRAVGEYFLAPALHGPTGPVPASDNYIVKHELYVRDAWEVGLNDVDGAGIREGDDPIIPHDQEKAPILELLRWKREHSRP